MVGFSAGGTGDILVRLIGQWLSERLGQPVIIDNRPGGAGNISTEAVAGAARRRHAAPGRHIPRGQYDAL